MANEMDGNAALVVEITPTHILFGKCERRRPAGRLTLRRKDNRMTGEISGSHGDECEDVF